MIDQLETFEQFMVRREAASLDFINGDAEALLALSADNDPATFFPPTGARLSGAELIKAQNAAGAKSFKKGSEGRFRIMHSAADQQIGFWTGVHCADVRLEGQEEPVTMQLRTTEIFRREQGHWKLVHRHADTLSDPES